MTTSADAPGPWCARITPRAGERERPLWSVMIPSFNAGDHLRESLAGVLAQDPGPGVMEIAVVDDASTTSAAAPIIDELARGRVTLHRNPRNLGLVGNLSRCIELARGHLIHLLHDDDAVRPGFYAAIGPALEAHPDAGAAFCRCIYMDADGQWEAFSPLERRTPGILEGWAATLAYGQRVATPSVVVRRAVYETLGGFDRRMSVAGEDWEMWVRIASRYPVWFEPEPLALYRVRRPGSLTESAGRALGIAGDMRRATEVIESYLPRYIGPAAASRASSAARRMYAGWALEGARDRMRARDPSSVARLLREAIACDPSPRTTGRICAFAVAAGYRGARRGLRAVRGPRA